MAQRSWMGRVFSAGLCRMTKIIPGERGLTFKSLFVLIGCFFTLIIILAFTAIVEICGEWRALSITAAYQADAFLVNGVIPSEQIRR